ncbi:TPA: helix-turn-helix domain-containing protein [Morganella morganii]|nr:helix-turn-helix domain-containing protein [Morganella morganii]
MTMDIHDRINICLSQLNLKNRHIVDATGASKATVSQWVNGKSAPSSKYIPSLARLFKVSESWLIEGGPNNEIPPDIRKSYSIRIREIPLISNELAANWHTVMHAPEVDIDAKSWIEVLDLVSPFAFAIKMDNNSMMTASGQGLSIPVGATLIADVGRQVKSGSIVVARVSPEDNEAVIKQFISDGPNRYLMSLNPNYERIQIDERAVILATCVKMELSLY